MAVSPVDEALERLEASGRFVRIDPTWPATMYRGTMLSDRELAALRQIADVVRLGRMQRIEADRIVLERGETRTSPEVLHVDCTALGLNNAPAIAIFQPGRIVLQQVRYLSPCVNAALVGFVEAHRDDERGQEPALPTPCLPHQPRGLAAHDVRHVECGRTLVERARPTNWIAESRLNLMFALPEYAAEPSVQAAVKRYLTHVRTAAERLNSWTDPSHPRGGGNAVTAQS